MEIRGRQVHPLILILILGAAVRLAISPFFCDYYDFSFWTSIAFDVRNGNGIYADYDLWYPPVWGYVIASVTPLFDLFNCVPTMRLVEEVAWGAQGVGQGWVPSIGSIVIIKLPLIVADVINGLLIFKIARRLEFEEKTAVCAAAMWMFCPLTIWVSGGQGQFDSISLMFILVAFYSYLKNSYLLCGMSIAAATLTKVFPALVVLPLMALILTRTDERKDNIRNTVLYAVGGIAMTALILLPQVIHGEMEFVLSFILPKFGGGYPTPSGFDYTAMAMSVPSTLVPSGKNVPLYLIPTYLVDLIITVFILAEKRFSDRHALLLVTASMCTFLMWMPAPGYIQYYVPIVGLLTMCMIMDDRFRLLYMAIVVLAMIPMLAGFANAYPLIEMGVDVGTVKSICETIRAAFSPFTGLASAVIFIPICLCLYFSWRLIRRERDGP